MKYFFGFGFFLVLGYCSLAQTKVPVIAEREYYEFFNAIPNPLAELHPVIQSEPELFNMYDAPQTNDRKLFDTIFSKSDTTFLVNQTIKAKSFYWGPGMINGATVVNKSDLGQIIGNDDAGWDRFDKMYRTRGYWVYSVPLFSVDKSICVVKYTNYCGNLCKANYVYYYKKEGDTWKAIYHYRAIINY